MAKLRFMVTERSSNQKTGPIVVTTTSRQSCPKSCELRGKGCYAEWGPLSVWWQRLSKPGSEFGLDFKQFLEKLRELPDDAVVRLNQAGDLPGRGRKLDRGRCRRIAKALGHVQWAWTYTHYPATEHNLAVVREMEQIGGVVVNFSHERAEDVETRAPAVVIVPSLEETPGRLADGRRVVICPAQRSKNETCSSCLLCAKGSERRFVVGFLPHGTKAEQVRGLAAGRGIV